MNAADLATLVYPDDRYPLVIIKRTKTTLTLARLNTDGIAPADYCNGFPVYNHRFTVEEAEARITDRTETAHKTKRGTYQLYGYAPVRLGEAHYYRNMAD